MQESPDHWEEELGRELESLPELEAPRTLIPRVLRAIERQQTLPWWHRSWESWPASMRYMFFLVGALVLGGWLAALWLGAQSPWTQTLLAQLNSLLSPLVWLGEVAAALGQALSIMVKSAGTVFWVSILSASALMYLACVALGTACVRLAKN